VEEYQMLTKMFLVKGYWFVKQYHEVRTKACGMNGSWFQGGVAIVIKWDSWGDGICRLLWDENEQWLVSE
jgi:hypothetical protein